MPAAWPVDPASGGTWIGVNAAGLAACLLNRSDRVASGPPAGFASSGTIIPCLLSALDLAEAAARLSLLRIKPFMPFTLLLIHGRAFVRLIHARGRFVARTGPLDRPFVVTSSSLGDRFVAAPRRGLFERMVHSSADVVGAQTRFHDHCWRDRPEISVRMTRPGAATVSRTIVEVRGATIRLRYTALDG